MYGPVVISETVCMRGSVKYGNRLNIKDSMQLPFLRLISRKMLGGIKWLKENVKDVEVVLEANGDSYSEYETGIRHDRSPDDHGMVRA